jgi:hypothetical protein
MRLILLVSLFSCGSAFIRLFVRLPSRLLATQSDNENVYDDKIGRVTPADVLLAGASLAAGSVAEKVGAEEERNVDSLSKTAKLQLKIQEFMLILDASLDKEKDEVVDVPPPSVSEAARLVRRQRELLKEIEDARKFVKQREEETNRRSLP